MAPPSPVRDSGDSSEEEDDYMSMVIEDPTTRKKESSLQRTATKKRERAIKAVVKPRAERQVEEVAAREQALDSAMDSSNKGFSMMAKLGFKPGATLGKQGGATEPVKVSTKEDRRGGVGSDKEKKEKKRKQRQEFERQAKRPKTDEEDFREVMRQKLEERRIEAHVLSAQRLAERLNDQDENTPLKSINVLWRGLERARLQSKDEKLTARLMSSSDEAYEEPVITAVDDNTIDMWQNDEELEQFSALLPAEKLEKLVAYLRTQHNYCFWCRCQYPNAEMEDCPGSERKDHDDY